MGRWAQYRKRGTAPASGLPLPPPLLTDFLLLDDGAGEATVQLEVARPPGVNDYRLSFVVNGTDQPVQNLDPANDPQTFWVGTPGDIINGAIAWLGGIPGPQLSDFSPAQTIELS